MDNDSHFEGELETNGVLQSKYLTFHLDDVEYGINIHYVVEIVCMQRITELPDTPPALRGIINLRGKVIPVLDLRLRFSMAERDYDERTSVIVVNIQNASIGLICDEVAEVVDIDKNKISPPPTIQSKPDANEFMEGIGRREDGEVVVLLNADKIVGNVDQWDVETELVE